MAAAWLAAALIWLWLGGAALRLGRALRPGAAAVASFAVALVVRLLALPTDALAGCVGHEALYCDLFLGARAPGGGDTTLYPAMQLWWSALGAILPDDPRLLVGLSALVSALGAAAMAGAAGALGGPWAGALAGLLVALHPAHAAWGTSAYNVALPWTALAISLRAAVAAREGGPLGGRWASLGGAAFALAVAGRLELAALGLLPLGLLALRDQDGRTALASRAAQGSILASLALALLAVGPLARDLPGEGERLLAFSINAPWTGPYAPFDRGWPLVALALPLALRARLGPILLAALAALVAHALYASFDDWGERHALAALPSLALVLSLGLAGAGRARALAGLLGLGALAFEVNELVSLRARYYADEAAFRAEVVEARYADLPRIPASPSALSPVDGRCAWISEEPRVAAEPYLSHFNLLNPAEAEALRAGRGCVHWCYGPEDWRWSSRAVADRAARLERLYALMPVAVVEDRDSGYACVVFSVGARRPGAL